VVAAKVVAVKVVAKVAAVKVAAAVINPHNLHLNNALKLQPVTNF